VIEKNIIEKASGDNSRGKKTPTKTSTKICE
jgi:hypothetical protein